VSPRVLKGHTSRVTSLAAFKIDRTAALASASHDRTIRLWDLQTGNALHVLEGHTSVVTSLAVFEIDGNAVLASGSYDRTVRLWDLRSGKTLRVLPGHKNAVTSLAAFEIDGTVALASGSHDRTIRLWNPRTGPALAEIPTHLGGVLLASAVRGGNVLAFGGGIALSIEAAKVVALVANQGVLTQRRFALNVPYAGSFVETKRDAATGELLQTIVGRNAWRDFIAVGYEADGRQSVRPIEDMAMAGVG
jgi:hypothetical protein